MGNALRRSSCSRRCDLRSHFSSTSRQRRSHAWKGRNFPGTSSGRIENSVADRCRCQRDRSSLLRPSLPRWSGYATRHARAFTAGILRHERDIPSTGVAHPFDLLMGHFRIGSTNQHKILGGDSLSTTNFDLSTNEPPPRQSAIAPLGMLRLKGSRVAVGDHLRLHQQDWNHALIIKAIEKIAQHKRLACEVLLVAVFHD